jgi:hypothetical protein
MAGQTAAEKRLKQREAKQKKLLIVLVPVLIAVAVFTVPRTLKQLRGGEEAAAPPAAATGSQELDPAAGGNTGTLGTQPAASADPTAVAASAKAVLQDTGSQPEASEGQLISFSRFDSRDPFVQLVEDEPTDTSTTDASGAVPTTTAPSDQATATPTTTTPTPTTPAPSVTPSEPTDPAPTVSIKVKIAVNGNVHVLAAGDSFPGDDPAFKVVAIGAGSVEIGLVSGTFSTGVNTITVKLGEPVTLISQPDGARYTVKLLGSA